MSKVCQLFSGSSGNSIFVSSGETKILVDAGVSAKRLTDSLQSIGESADKLTAIFVTHEHSDHISGLRVFAKKYSIPVFTNEKVLERLVESGHITNGIYAESVDGGMELGGIEILPFENSHDSVACFGYRFNLKNSRSVSVCTDTGYVTDSARRAVSGSDMIFLESNHEIRMLENGPYTYMLKKRILSDRGHLSNDACSEFASELVGSGTTRIVLSHLSKDNNTPDLAYQTTLCRLQKEGYILDRDFRLRVSPPINSERPIVL